MNTWHTKPQGTAPIEGDRVTLVKGDRMVAFVVDHIDPDGNLWDGEDEPQSLPYSTEDGWKVTRVEERRILPGVVGMATVRGVEGVRVMRVEGRDNTENRHRPGVYVWRSATLVAGGELHTEEDVTDFVPDDAEALRAELEETRNEAEADASNIRGLSARVQRITRERDEARAEAHAAREVAVSEYERAEEFSRQVKEEHERVDGLRKTIDTDRTKWSMQVIAQREEIDRLRTEIEFLANKQINKET